MREYEIAELAVQAALDAGARYADVRVMHRDQQMLSARNGDIEAVMSSADSGIGVRALVGSGWGFYATAELDDALAIPVSAIFRRDGQWQAFSVEDGRARLRPLELGERNRDYVQVLEGIEAGTEVIVFPSDLVVDGIRVRERAE